MYGMKKPELMLLLPRQSLKGLPAVQEAVGRGTYI
jgi:hypothetical protein